MVCFLFARYAQYFFFSASARSYLIHLHFALCHFSERASFWLCEFVHRRTVRVCECLHDSVWPVIVFFAFAEQNQMKDCEKLSLLYSISTFEFDRIHCAAICSVHLFVCTVRHRIPFTIVLFALPLFIINRKQIRKTLIILYFFSFFLNFFHRILQLLGSCNVFFWFHFFFFAFSNSVPMGACAHYLTQFSANLASSVKSDRSR